MTAEDLTGQVFGYLKVIKKAPDRVTPSGQKRKYWHCECLLCGIQKDVSAQSLKRGDVKSCGCYKASKRQRNIKSCIICGRNFESPPSSNKVTCCRECQIEYARRRKTGKPVPEKTRKKISSASKWRDMSEIQRVGTESAKRSPKSGKFETNQNAIDWHLVSPEGKHYYFHSLKFWLRENCKELFGCEPDSHEFQNIRSGLSNAKRAALGKNYPCCTYKGWQAIPTDDDKNSKASRGCVRASNSFSTSKIPELRKSLVERKPLLPGVKYDKKSGKWQVFDDKVFIGDAEKGYDAVYLLREHNLSKQYELPKILSVTDPRTLQFIVDNYCNGFMTVAEITRKLETYQSKISGMIKDYHLPRRCNCCGKLFFPTYRQQKQCSPECKVCIPRIGTELWNDNNGNEYARKKGLEYYYANKEKVRLQQREYYQKMKELLKSSPQDHS